MTWLRWLDRVAICGGTCLFAAAPDRFDPLDIAGNFAATQERWHRYHHEVSDRGLPPAWVAQNGATPDDIPYDASAVFIGGDTAAAKARGMWAHVGRINGGPRFASAAMMLADSADGNLLSNGCITNWHRIEDWLDSTRPEHPQGRLALFGPS